MKNNRKICIITGSRAEYGVLYWIMKELSLAEDFELQLVVTGMHLSPEFGLTYKEIEKDGFVIHDKIEMLLSSDSPVGIAKSMGLGMMGFADTFAKLNPELLLVVGDRFEIFSAVACAAVTGIPVAHLSGGETTEGAFDEYFRHSITKMSHLHFTATEEYRDRVIQLGEHPDRVFNVGAAGIENISRLSLLSREEFEDSIGFKLTSKNLLVTFHPATLEKTTAKKQFSNLLAVLDELEDTHLLFTKSNADPDGRIINSMIDDFASCRPEKSFACTSLGQLRYLSALQYVDAVVGNSSSGLIEAPSFKIGTINIGDRQRGRVRAESVIDCKPEVKEIRGAFTELYSKSFQDKLRVVKNPHGIGNVSQHVVNILRSQNLDGILKKQFFKAN